MTIIDDPSNEAEERFLGAEDEEAKLDGTFHSKALLNFDKRLPRSGFFFVEF